MTNKLRIHDRVTVIETEYLKGEQRFIGRIGTIIEIGNPSMSLKNTWTGPEGNWWNVRVNVPWGTGRKELHTICHELELIRICPKHE